MPGFQVTSDSIPQAAVCTLFPWLCFWKGILTVLRWSRTINGEGLFELKERKRLVIRGEWRWNCWVEMEEKQNERERLREARWWKPHVGWPYRIQSKTGNLRWEVKKGIISSIYRQTLQS
jgi:hypothetical protein